MGNYSNFINGEQVGVNFHPNINPSDTTDIIGYFARASKDDVDYAIDSAFHASQSWGNSNISKRAHILKKTSELIIEQKNYLGEILSREQGKTLPEGIAEVVRAAQIFEFYASECFRIDGLSIQSIRDNVDINTRREAVGVVGIITPWNFPIAIPAWKIAPALCYGNTIVFKPADLVPASAWMLVNILHEAGLPPGVLNLVMGQGSVIGEIITNDSRVNAVTFTGSTGVGKIIADNCSKRLCKVQLEMGGKNPLVVMEDANLEQATDIALSGAYFSTGQRCTASSRFILSEQIHDEFLEKLKEKLKNTNVGHALDPNTKIGPVVDNKQLETNLKYIDIGLQEGANLEWGGNKLTLDYEGYYFAPALFTEVNNSMRIAQEEIFGPVACAIKFKNFEEAIQIANSTQYGLAAGICTNNLKYSQHFIKQMNVGMVMVNLPTAGVDFHVPFGGRKGSSYGPKEQGRTAVEFFTNVKTAYIAV